MKTSFNSQVRVTNEICHNVATTPNNLGLKVM